MPLRFRRSIRVLPFLRLNVSKRGASVSIGGRGAHVTLGHGQVRETVGLPGSGISYTHISHGEGARAEHPQPVTEPSPKGRAWRGWLWVLLLLAILAIVVSSVHS
jgi:Protein of unknown function (DUF4236)